MNIKIVVGDVELHVDGLDMSKTDLTRLLNRVARVANQANEGTDLADMIAAAQTDSDDDDTPDGKDLDAHLTLSADDAPLFGFSTWRPEDPEWVPEEAP